MTSGRWNRRVVGACAARVGELALDEVDDPRKRAGRWPIQTLMSAALMGLSARCLNLSEVEDLTENLSSAVRGRLGIRGRVPDTTMRDLLVRMDTETLRSRLYSQNKLARRRKALEPDGLPFGVVALDGKTTATPMTDGNRYAQTQHDEDGRVRCGLVRTLTSTLVSSRAQVCLDAHPIPPQTNEMGAFPEAFGRLVQIYSEETFQLITTDSGSCSEHNGRLVEDADRAYLFRLKAGDQPTLHQEAHRLLGWRRAEEAEAETVDVVGSKTVSRRIWRTDEMAGYHGWDHLRTTIRIESEAVDASGKRHVEQRYYVSSLRLPRLSAGQWLRIVRLHWRVENGNHWVWDAIFREDERPWIQEPQGMLVVMLLRRIAYNLVSLFRSVTQRSEDNRRVPWKKLLKAIDRTLTSATEPQLVGLRVRSPSVSA